MLSTEKIYKFPPQGFPEKFRSFPKTSPSAAEDLQSCQPNTSRSTLIDPANQQIKCSSLPDEGWFTYSKSSCKNHNVFWTPWIARRNKLKVSLQKISTFNHDQI